MERTKTRSRVSFPRGPASIWSKTRSGLDSVIPQISSPRLINKPGVLIYVCLAFVVGWLLLFVTTTLSASRHSSVVDGLAALRNYFGKFEGLSECKIHATELYNSPPKDRRGFYGFDTFCRDRTHLLKALSEGGRVGFDAPYMSRDCYYRWFEVEEMCFILERFDGLVFVGDETLQTIYAGMNILLRQDLALGSLNLASMAQSLQEECRCNNQFVRQDCRQHHLSDSQQASQGEATGSPHFCNRIRHAFLEIESPQPGTLIMDKFRELVPRAPRSKYRPIPIIHSLAPSSMSVNDATNSLLRFVDLADDSGRNTPMLWIGPTAAGHIEIKGRKGNQEIWDFDRKLAATAREKDVDVLGMWNMTVQATSSDGIRFGEKVAITQAMMVFNWLSRLESS